MSKTLTWGTEVIRRCNCAREMIIVRFQVSISVGKHPVLALLLMSDLIQISTDFSGLWVRSTTSPAACTLKASAPEWMGTAAS